MRPYGEFCPITRAAELFSERWTPMILRELICGSSRFSELQSGLPGIPRSLLASRLKTLADADVIVRLTGDSPRKVRYELTQRGRELGDVVVALGIWGQKWFNRELHADRVDTRLLVWDMRRRVHLDRLPDKRVVVQFDFTGAENQSLWLILEKPQPSACDFDPGFDVDIHVKADALEMTKIWMGLRTWKTAIADRKISFTGPSHYTSVFTDWFQLNFFSTIPAGIDEAIIPAKKELVAAVR